MDRAGKEGVKADLLLKLGGAKGLILTEYRGLTTGEITELRTNLRKFDAEYKISKNRLLRKAMLDGPEDFRGLEKKLVGPIGTVVVYGDIAQAAKQVVEFAKTHEKMVVVGAALEGGSLVGSKELSTIADLPSKDVLLQKILGCLTSPHRGLVTVLGGNARKLVQVLAAIKDTKQA